VGGQEGSDVNIELMRGGPPDSSNNGAASLATSLQLKSADLISARALRHDYLQVSSTGSHLGGVGASCWHSAPDQVLACWLVSGVLVYRTAYLTEVLVSTYFELLKAQQQHDDASQLLPELEVGPHSSACPHAFPAPPVHFK
jgi:hypothetical protein